MSTKKKTDFKKVYTQGKAIVGRSVVIYSRPTLGKRIGFSVSKKVGNAVERNRVKRQLREICRNNFALFPENHDYVLVARVRSKTTPYRQIEKEIVKKIAEV